MNAVGLGGHVGFIPRSILALFWMLGIGRMEIRRKIEGNEGEEKK